MYALSKLYNRTDIEVLLDTADTLDSLDIRE